MYISGIKLDLVPEYTVHSPNHSTLNGKRSPWETPRVNHALIVVLRLLQHMPSTACLGVVIATTWWLNIMLGCCVRQDFTTLYWNHGLLVGRAHTAI